MMVFEDLENPKNKKIGKQHVTNVVKETLKKVEGLVEDLFPKKEPYLVKGKKQKRQFYNLRYITSIGSEKRIFTAYLSASRYNIEFYFERMNQNVWLFKDEGGSGLVQEVRFHLFRHDPVSHLVNLFQTGKFEKEYLVISEPPGCKGSYGCVKIVLNKYDKLIYAVKKFDDLSIKKGDYLEEQTYFREILYLSHIQHPNIVRSFNWWLEETEEQKKNFMQTESSEKKAEPEEFHFNIYLLTEYIGDGYGSNSNLKHHIVNYLYKLGIKERKKEIYQIFKQVLEGIRYLHQEGYVHRDIKPENIFIHRKDEICAKIGDFGFAKQIIQFDELSQGLKLTKFMSKAYQQSEIVKTPYKPPETCNAEYKFISDIY